MYYGSKTYPASSSLMTKTPSEASWNMAPVWDPVEESTTAHSVSRNPQPRRNLGFPPPPPPPPFQGGELEHYEESFEHGDSERETEELNNMPPPPPYLGSDFKAGELSRYEAMYEHGNEERETEEQGFQPLPPYELSATSMPDSRSLPGPSHVGPVGPSQYHLFLTGQLPPGTVSHYQYDYDSGRDNWDEVHYEKYHFPDSQSLTVPTQTHGVPSDALWQQLQDYTKS